ncbi:MAG: dihydrofolate reductase [Planctomycetota bacterium]|jgi:phosphoglycerate dehydrogenase-like enzyme|nr:dihydrofolate reductase [Planctomycetota bacterium]
MKNKILITFWIPPEVAAVLDGEAEAIFPGPAITGVYSRAELEKFLPEMDAVAVDLEVVDRETIDLGVRLKAIGRNGVGCDLVDCDYAARQGVAVINSPTAVTQPTAELAVGLMLDVARRLTFLDKKLRRDRECLSLPNYETLSTNLFGKTLGIIGYGRIGRAVGVKARGLGMKIIYAHPRPVPAEAEAGARRVSHEELLKTADFVSVHTPYLPANHHLIDEKALTLMKPGAYLINTSRGRMVDEAALVRALKTGAIRGAALDVYEREPEINQDLVELDNVVLVPHIGTWTYDAEVAMMKETLGGIRDYLAGGNPPNVFNREKLDKYGAKRG